MTKHTLQSLFNKSVKGLAGQEFERAVDILDNCVYLAADGKRCAIGHLLSKAKARVLNSLGGYNSCIQHSQSLQNITDVLDERLSEDYPNAYDVLGRELQQCHDTASDSKEVVANLINFAAVNDLKLPKELT